MLEWGLIIGGNSLIFDSEGHSKTKYLLAFNVNLESFKVPKSNKASNLNWSWFLRVSCNLLDKQISSQ